MLTERQNAYRLIAIQASLILILSLLFLLASIKAAYSVFLGGACCVLPSIYFAFKLFKYIGARMAKKAIAAFYLGEVVKLIMVAVLSVLVFKFVAILPLYFFIGFIVAQFVFWIAPNILLQQQMKAAGGVQ